MTSCPTCAFPNTDAASCAFCGDALVGPAPVLAHLANDGGGFRLLSGERLLAGARTAGGVLRVSAGDSAGHTLVPLRDDRGIEVVLFDARLNVVSSIREVGATLPSSAVLCSANEEPVAIARADGAGGLNVIGADGSVLLFAGRSRRPAGGLDVLVTDAGLGRPLVGLFALLVTLEAQRLGPLHASSAGERPGGL